MPYILSPRRTVFHQGWSQHCFFSLTSGEAVASQISLMSSSMSSAMSCLRTSPPAENWSARVPAAMSVANFVVRTLPDPTQCTVYLSPVCSTTRLYMGLLSQVQGSGKS